MSTIHDVARAAGVSIATVSRSFGAKNQVHIETRRRVLREAERLNYRARNSGQTLIVSEHCAGMRSRSIGFVYFASTPSDKLPSNSFYGPVLAGAQAAADSLGMYLMPNTASRQSLTKSLPQMICEQAVSGALLVGTADSAMIESVVKFVPNIVLVDSRDPMMRRDCVISDGFRGAMGAVEHLLRHGHRRIAFVTGRSANAAFGDRLNGYLCTLHHSGIDVNRGLICTVETPDMATDMNVTVDQILDFFGRFSEADYPTAIVAGNDAHALAVLHACRRAGISVPGQMSIVGFDDTEFSAHTYPALTTMRVDKENMGRVALQRLWNRIQEGSVGAAPCPPMVVELPVRLIERGSCAGPSKACR